MSNRTFYDCLTEHRAVFDALPLLSDAVGAATALLARCLRSGGKILLCGNGGSASDSQHIAAELVGRFVSDRVPLAAIALSTDTSILTAVANDYGYDRVFARQVAALGRAGDCLIGLSTSGNSPNVIEAVRVARETGMTTVLLSGRDGGQLRGVCDVELIVPSDVTARIQEAHIFIGHVLCASLEVELGFVKGASPDVA
jgi:D-sedoheptulose 7-phosphate isomerase